MLRNFGHFRNCTTTACKSISSMLLEIPPTGVVLEQTKSPLFGIGNRKYSMRNNSLSESDLSKSLILPAHAKSDTYQSTPRECDLVLNQDGSTNGNDEGSIITVKDFRVSSRRRRSVSWAERGEEGQLKPGGQYRDNYRDRCATLPINMECNLGNGNEKDATEDINNDSDSDSGPEEDLGDVEIEVIRAVLEEQRMMLLPECLNHTEMADINTRHSNTSLQSSNFDMGLVSKSIEHNFQNGVRIVSKAEDDPEPELHEAGIYSNATRDGQTATSATGAVQMATSIEIEQVNVRARQERFQAAGVCEALVEVGGNLLYYIIDDIV